MASKTSLTAKDEFVNTTDGWVGVVQLDHLNAAKGAAVEPQGSVFLNEEEQILTANAPRADADNPFANGALQLKTRSSEIRNRRPWGADAAMKPNAEPAAGPSGEPGSAPPVETPEETGATVPPAGDAPEGAMAEGEEVATPDAPAKMAAKPRRRKAG